MNALHRKLVHFENHVHHRLVLYGISSLRISVGIVFLLFGTLKFFPGVSPAEDLTLATTHYLFLGLMPDAPSLVIVATLECVIGICLLLSGPAMRVGIWLLVAQFVGILSPLVLLPSRLFAGPYHAPTLEGQYVIKDIVLVAAAFVIAAGAFRGGRLIRGDLAPAKLTVPDHELDADQRLRIVLDGIGNERLVAELCERNGMTEGEYYHWRETTIAAATLALERDAADADQLL